MYVHINTFKASKDIAAGQEIFVSYGTTGWFESKKIPYANVDYASTMWRPDLHPLPCRQSVRHTTGAGGRDSFAVLEAVPSGTVVDISLCVKVSIIVVDQFPVLWDFVIMGATTQTVCTREDAEVCWKSVYSYEQTSPCQIPQACIPLSYAAQIPTTPNPDLANVRVSLLSNLDQNVRQRSVRFLCVYVLTIACEKKSVLCVIFLCCE